MPHWPLEMQIQSEPSRSRARKGLTRQATVQAALALIQGNGDPPRAARKSG